MRLGEFRDGYLVPYPDVCLLKLEAANYGDFKCGKFYLKRLDPTMNMQRIFGVQPGRIYYVEDKKFLEYCQSIWRDVKVVAVADIPDPPSSDLPAYYVTGTCKKCKRNYIFDTGRATKDQIITRLQSTPFGVQNPGQYLTLGECPAGGWHTELGTMFDNMDFDFTHIYREVRTSAKEL